MNNTKFFLFTAIGMLAFLSASLACDTTPTEVAQNIQYIGKGLYSIDIENCIGNAGSENGFTISISGVNIVDFSPDTIKNVFNGNIALGTLSDGVINYDYTGAGYFVEAGQNSCFSSKIVVDDYPEASIVTFTGVNTPGGCVILDGDTQTTPVIETPVCGDIFYDTGGSDGPYADGENYYVVICGGAGPVTLQFTEFELVQDGDIMTIYDNDAPSGSSEFYVGNNSPGIVTSTNPSNCLTVVFESNSFTIYGELATGWVAEVICGMPCPNGLMVDVMDNLQDAEVYTVVSGGSLPYTFTWNTGDDTYNTEVLVSGTYAVTVEDANSCMAVDSISLKVVSVIEPEDCASDFENCSSKFGLIDLYPNPAQASIHVSFEVQNNQEAIQVKLIDVLGRTLEEQHITPDIGFNETRIDISNLKTAMYFVLINNGTQQSVKKFLKR